MAKLSRDLASETLHPREDIYTVGELGSLNSEVIISSDGCSTLTLDLRGTFVLTIEVSGTVDGSNWQLIALRTVNQASKLYIASLVGSATGTWLGAISGFRKVRARVTAYTSGSATATLLASIAPFNDTNVDNITSQIATVVGAAGAGTVLTLTSPGAGLRHYITYLSINKFATALLTAGATPITITTTNLPGNLAFSFAADAAAAGSLDRWREDFAFPLAASTQNNATTIVTPATTGVIWRITAGYYISP